MHLSLIPILTASFSFHIQMHFLYAVYPLPKRFWRMAAALEVVQSVYSPPKLLPHTAVLEMIYYARHCCPHNSISSVKCDTSFIFPVSTFRRQVLVGQAPCALHCVYSQHFHMDMYFTQYSCMLMNTKYGNSTHYMCVPSTYI